ncbi:MAG: MBL fold metallo-hydrolase [Clostridiales bacterium]|nr:MBL fold metallo-hydrolase [Clostridiales bacterium]
MSVQIKRYPKGPLQENTYLLTDEATGLKAIIDPGYIGDEIKSEIGDKDNLKYVMLTHGHYDHFYCAEEYLKDYPNAKFVAPKKDIYLMSKDWNKEFLAFGNSTPQCPKADIYVVEGDEINLGDSVFGFIETPGHTEGGICIQLGDIVFSGDTLFKLSVGNSSFETGNWDMLLDSIKNKLYVLDENTIVYPGHGLPTTILFEKKSNPFV